MKTYVYALFALLFLPVMTLADDGPPTPVDFGPMQGLTVETQNGPVSFQVEFAKTSEQRSRGLMYRQSMDDNVGMLFDMERPHAFSFWMKNTYIPLDLIFIGTDGDIMSIARNARPKSVRHIYSNGAALAVLEINGGYARKFGIERGDLVHHAMFNNEVDTSIDADKGLPQSAETPNRTPE